MKKFTKILPLVLVLALPAHGQLVQSINFDTYTSATNNDLVNNFTGTYNFTQQQTGGITGGGIPIPVSLPPQAAVYKNLLKISTAKTTASICFKFSNAAFQNSTTEAASLRFFSDPIDFIQVDMTGQILATGNNYSGKSTSISSGGKLADAHWYQLKGEVSLSTSTTVNVSTWVYDLGTSGTATPVLVLSRLNDSYNNEFASKNNIVNLQFYGSQSGGGVMLDNFNVNSQTLGIGDPRFDSKFSVATLQNNEGFFVSSTLNASASYELFGNNGALLFKGTLQNGTIIPSCSLASGHYYLRIYNQENSLTKRVIKY